MKKCTLSLVLLVLAACSTEKNGTLPPSTPTTPPVVTPPPATCNVTADCAGIVCPEGKALTCGAGYCLCGTPLTATCETDADCNTPACAPGAFCNYAKVCTRLPQDNLCAAGSVCLLKEAVETSGCYVPPRCGDGKCNGTETYVDCPVDCPAPPIPPKPECVVNTDCDDGIGCTSNSCVEGKCRFAADNSVCAAFETGATCIVGSTILLPVKGAPTGCFSQINESSSAAICDDKIACTYDSMKADMTCAHITLDSKCQAGYHCDASQGCVRNAPVCTMPEPLPCAKDECTYDGVKRANTCGANAICLKTGCQANITTCPVGVNCVVPSVVTKDPDPVPVTPVADPHVISCAADGNVVLVNLQGNLKTGLVKTDVVGVPKFVAFGADAGACGWPAGEYVSTLSDPCSGLRSVAVAADGSWSIPQFALSSDVQGFNLYVVMENGFVAWIQLDKWTVTGDCTLKGTKIDFVK